MPTIEPYAELVKARWEAAKRLRHMFDLHWEKGIRKYAGQMWLRWDPASETWHPAVGRRDLKLRRTNLVRRDARVLAALMLSNFPHPIARPGPGTGTLEDKRQGAEYATGLFQQWWEDQQWNRLLRKIAGTCLMVGNAYVRCTWNQDDTKSMVDVPMPPVATPETVPMPETYCPNCEQMFQGQHQTCPSCGMMTPPENVTMRPQQQMVMKPPMGPDGQPMMQQQPLGDVGFEWVPFPEIYPPRRATGLDDAGYLFRLRWAAPEWVKQQTGIQTEATRIDGDQLFDWKTNTITGDPDQFDVLDEEQTTIEDLAPYLEYIERPNVKNPKGLYCVLNGTSAQQIVKDGVYPENPLPFELAHFRYVTVPGRFLGASMIEDAYPINDQLNAEVSHMDLMRTRFLFSKWATFSGSNVRPGQLSGNNDTVECTSPDLMPKMLMPFTPIPQLMESAALTMNRLRDVTMAQLPLTGEQPGSVRSGKGINALKEQAMLPLFDVVKEWAENVKALFGAGLWLAQKYYTEDRSFEIFGVGGPAQYMSFKGLDLKRPGLAVHVNMDEVFPFTQAMRRDAFGSLLQYAGPYVLQTLGTDPAFMQSLLDLFGLPKDQYNVEYNLHIRAAHLEMEAFLADPQGSPLVVDPDFDVHGLHFSTHAQFLAGDRGKELAKTQPQLYQLARQHALEHKQIFAQQQAQMQMQQQAGGEPPPAAGGGPPRKPSAQSARR